MSIISISVSVLCGTSPKISSLLGRDGERTSRAATL